ncbi:MAG: polysaccharide export protein [Magnetococcales bacterium]|nr:polysaccharide export protein [Magnetococcales bacterium]
MMVNGQDAAMQTIPHRLMRCVAHVLVFVIVALLVSSEGLSSDNTTYRLAAGDKISIQVFGEPDLSSDFLIGESESITFPLLGQVRVGGLTVRELEQLVTARLKGRFLVNPGVSAQVTEYRKFFIKGEVNQPGGFPYIPGLTLQKAVSLAGGFTNRADKGKIFIRGDRDGPDEKNEKQPSNLDDFVFPGDMITVERRFF